MAPKKKSEPLDKSLAKAYDYAVKTTLKAIASDKKLHSTYKDTFRGIKQPVIDKIMILEPGQGFNLTLKGPKVAKTFGKALNKKFPKEFFVKFLSHDVIDLNRKEDGLYLIKDDEVVPI